MNHLKSKTNSYFCAMFKKLLFAFLGFALFSCAKETQPKPSGELRLEYPVAKYEKFTSPCNFGFEYSSFAKIVDAKNPCWYYIDYPKMKTKVFVTYFPVKKK